MQEEKIWNKYMSLLRFDELNSIEWKNLKVCIIDTLFDGKEYLKIPEGVEELIFSVKFNENLDNLIIPISVKNIQFNENFSQDLSKFKINDNILINFSEINKLCAETLPLNLKYLGIVMLKFPLTNLPSSLNSLFIYEGKEHLDNSKIPFGCIVNSY